MATNNNQEDLNERAESAVRNHVIWSMGAGFIPIPIADFVAVAAVQLDMIRTISNVYGVDFKETEGKALVTSLTGSGLSRLGANALIKLIPGFGSMLGGVSMSIVSGASTYALGQVFKKHFAVGGTFLDFDTDRFQRYYDEQFEKGKTVAEDIQKEKEHVLAVAFILRSDEHRYNKFLDDLKSSANRGRDEYPTNPKSDPRFV